MKQRHGGEAGGMAASWRNGMNAAKHLLLLTRVTTPHARLAAPRAPANAANIMSMARSK